MSTNTRRILLSCVSLAVVACFCIGVIIISGAGVTLLTTNSAPSPLPLNTLVPTSTPFATQTTTETPLSEAAATQTTSVSTPTAVATQSTPVATPSAISLPTLPGPTLSADISQEMDQIQAEVISYRGLQATTQVKRGVLTTDQLRQKVVTEFLQDYTQADANKDVTILNAFGLLPSGFDYLTFQENFLTEQVAGFYDNTTKEMYVISDEGFTGLQKFNYAHEYTHFLQDQNFDIQGKLGYSEEKCKNDSERCAAIQALMEGDATLSQEEWLVRYSTQLDQQQISQFAQTFKSPVYDSAPEFYKDDAMFPYNQGLEFVQTLYDQGGWQSVDNAYHNPPVSTEQILHPDLYPDEKPVSVSLPDLSTALGSDWTQLDKDTVGEWYTYLILSAGYDSADRLPTSVAKQAAAGWGGDTYAVYQNAKTGAVALAVIWQWDTSKDATEFMNAFKQYGDERWGSSVNSSSDSTQWDGPQSFSTITLSGQSTTWILSPDAQTASEMEAALK